jgi:hypothetical protein
MSTPISDPRVQLRDVEARLVRFERWTSIASAGVLTLAVSSFAILVGHL